MLKIRPRHHWILESDDGGFDRIFKPLVASTATFHRPEELTIKVIAER